MKALPFLFSALFAVFTLFAQAQERHNVDKNGVILKGYDPVAYFTEQKAVKGSADLTYTHRGDVYQFSSAANREAFKSDPDKYAPLFGGYCGYAVSQGYTYDIDPRQFTFADGRLVLQYNASALASWKKDPKSLEKAKGNWERLKKK